MLLFLCAKTRTDANHVLCHLLCQTKDFFHFFFFFCLHFHFPWAMLIYPVSWGSLNSRATLWKSRTCHLLSLIIECGFLSSSVGQLQKRMYSFLYSFLVLGNFLWRLIEVICTLNGFCYSGTNISSYLHIELFQSIVFQKAFSRCKCQVSPVLKRYCTDVSRGLHRP